MNVFTFLLSNMLVVKYEADTLFEACQQARLDGYTVVKAL